MRRNEIDLPADIERGYATGKGTRRVEDDMDDRVVTPQGVSRQIVAVFRSNGSGRVEDGLRIDSCQIDGFERTVHHTPFEEVLDRRATAGVDMNPLLVANDVRLTPGKRLGRHEKRRRSSGDRDSPS